MKIYVTVEVDAPDGATHYFGDLLHDVSWVKFVPGGPSSHAARQHDQWYQYHRAQHQWFLISEHRPHWAKPINKETILCPT